MIQSISELLSLFQSGDSVFIPGSSAEPRPLVEALAAEAINLPPLEIVHSFVPGINTVPLAAEDNRLTETSIFPRKAFPGSEQRLRLMPLSYYGYVNYLADRQFDWAIANLSTPNEKGYCSLGVSAEFLPQVQRNCQKVVGLLNQQMPFMAGSPKLHLDELHAAMEVDWPLVSYDPGPPDEVSQRITAHIAELIEPGSVLQVGLGKVPNQLLAALDSTGNIGFHSGMLSDGFLTMQKQGALDPGFMHTTCSVLGSKELYEQVVDLPALAIQGVDQSHSPAKLNRLQNFIAINSALEVDLQAQANLETIGERHVSGVGGAADFVRAARVSPGGKSIVALPATARGGERSRIQTQLDGIVSLGRYDIDYVVTEYGIANLVGKSTQERAQALSAVAAPQFRKELRTAAQKNRDQTNRNTSL